MMNSILDLLFAMKNHHLTLLIILCSPLIVFLVWQILDAINPNLDLMFVWMIIIGVLYFIFYFIYSVISFIISINELKEGIREFENSLYDD